MRLSSVRWNRPVFPKEMSEIQVSETSRTFTNAFLFSTSIGSSAYHEYLEDRIDGTESGLTVFPANIWLSLRW